MRNKYLRNALSALLITGSSAVYAQNMAINQSGNPGNAAAVLDMSDASNAHLGLLLPNVSLSSVTDVTTIPSPVDGLIVYNTNASIGSGFGVGFYYWSASSAQWLFVSNTGAPGVTTFSAGTTGFTPNTATTGAVTLGGILNISNGGTGLGTAPSSDGQLLIGTSGGTYNIGTITSPNGTMAFGFSTPNITADLAQQGATTNQVLQWNGTQWAPGTVTVPIAANPSALVGLTAVNGSAATFMRSDAAPALDQSITPTWTGLHTYAPASGDALNITNGGIQLSGVAGTTGQVLTSAGTGAAPTWTTPTTGTVTGSGAATQVAFWSGTTAIAGNNNLWWDNTNDRLGIITNAPNSALAVGGAGFTNVELFATTAQPGNFGLYSSNTATDAANGNGIAVYGTTNQSTAAAVEAVNSYTTANTYGFGVYGSASTAGSYPIGVFGAAGSTATLGAGLMGQFNGTNTAYNPSETAFSLNVAAGVYGTNTSTPTPYASGSTPVLDMGVYGSVTGTDGANGTSGSTGVTYGIRGDNSSNAAIANFGGTPIVAPAYGAVGQNINAGPSPSITIGATTYYGPVIGVRGSVASDINGTGVIGYNTGATNTGVGNGVYGLTSQSNGFGILGVNKSATATAAGVEGSGNVGVAGFAGVNSNYNSQYIVAPTAPVASAGVYGSSSVAGTYALYANNTTGATGNGLNVNGITNMTGNLASILGVSYTWPSSNASGVLTNNGTGGLSWTSVSGFLTGANNGLSLSGTNVQLGGNLIQTTSVGLNGNTLSVAGSSVTETYAATGKVGIGTTTPQNNLDVATGMAVGTYAGTNAAPSNGMIVSGQVGVGNNAPNTLAIVDMSNATNLGFMPPSMTTANLPASPPAGLIVFNSTTGCLQVANGNVWQNIFCTCSGPPTTLTAISGPTSCVSTSTAYTYTTSVDAGANYVWSISNTNLATGSSSTNSITITTTATTGTFTLSVYASNTCGNTTTQTVTITTGNYHGTAAFAYTGGIQSWTVPACVTQVTVQVWGAAGSAGVTVTSASNAGGGGAYIIGTLTVTATPTLYILVGQGGAYNNSNGLVNVYGGGGYGNTGNGGYSGGGGGRSAIQYPSGTDIVTAGGGGGGCAQYYDYNEGATYYYWGNGGGGGATTGATGQIGYSATGGGGVGGTVAAGGAGGTSNGPTYQGTAGTLYTGGHPETTTADDAGGGGGGGYYGGGGGDTYWGAGGGGGSSFPATNTGTFTITSNLPGTTVADGTNASAPSGGAAAPNYVAGVGLGNHGAAGGAGRVVITY